eukprot:12420235-Karenia_brevis.AAC.1
MLQDKNVTFASVLDGSDLSLKEGCSVRIATASHASPDGSDPCLKDFNSQGTVNEGCVSNATASHATPALNFSDDS